MTNTLYLLVGLPASGKSYWTRENVTKNTMIISSDNYIEMKARESGITYNEAFPEHIKNAEKFIWGMADNAKEFQNDVIWDQTNTSKKKRKRIIDHFKNYQKFAIVFAMPSGKKELEIWSGRIKSRPGKTIPAAIIKSMADNYQEPTRDEGFDKIVHVNSFEDW